MNTIYSLSSSDKPYNGGKAYINVLKAINALSGIGNDYKFEPVTDSNIREGDLVQYAVNSSDKSSPMYKYLMICNNQSKHNTYDVSSMFLTAINMNGDVVSEENKNDELHDVKRLRYEAWASDENYPKSDADYWGAFTIHTNKSFENLRDIFAIYGNVDPTGLEYRIKDIVSRPDTGLKTGAISRISVGAISAAAGLGLLIAGILVCCGVITSEFGVSLILYGITLIISGTIGIITGSY